MYKAHIRINCAWQRRIQAVAEIMGYNVHKKTLLNLCSNLMYEYVIIMRPI